MWSDRVEIVGDCWIWNGPPTPKGYGQVKRDGRMWKAHRYVYTQLVGPIPGGLQLDHLCRVNLCVNPDHLEPVTNAENQRRGIINQNAGKTTCKRGHRFDETNTYLNPDGRRQCRICREASRVKYRDRRAEILAGVGSVLVSEGHEDRPGIQICIKEQEQE